MGMFGGILGLQDPRPYLISEEFIVHTDNTTVWWLLTVQEPSGCSMRWRFCLEDCNFLVQYKRGPRNVHADALSRLWTNAAATSNDWDKILSFLIENPLDSTDSLHRK